MHALYRFYLYTVFILLSIYATYTSVVLLSTLFQLTPIRALYETPPSSNDIVQAITLALVSFLVILLIGGLHYWLIRRDIVQNPAEAGASSIRSFFLHITEGIAAALSLPTLGYVLLSLASSNSVAFPLAFALPTLALALLLELERQRVVSPATGARAGFLRIHTYGVQMILLTVLGISWSQVILPIIDGLLFGGRAQTESCGGLGQCPHENLFLLALAGLWFTGTWLFYGWLTSHDSSRSLRFVLDGLGFAAGISIILTGLYNIFTVILLFFFHEPATLSDILGITRYDFVGLLTLGLLITSMYHVWMRAGVRRGLLPAQTSLQLIELAILSVLTAITFWWGMGNLFYNTFALLFKFSQPRDSESWISAGAFVLAGCISIVVEFYLRHKNRSEPEIAARPRRAQVLALLAIGTLTLSIAIATTLYIGLTTLLKSPIANWMEALSFGLATLLVGLALAGFYLYTALNERQFARTTKPAPTTPGTPEQTPNPTQQAELAAIETILNQLLANQITHTEASTKIYDLIHVTETHEI